MRMIKEIRTFQVEEFSCQQDLSLAGTQIKMINNVRVSSSGIVCIADILRLVKRESVDFDETSTGGYLMSLGLYLNSIIKYVLRHFLPVFSLCYSLKMLGCVFEKLEHLLLLFVWLLHA